MNITKEQLQKDIASFEQQRSFHNANLSALEGATKYAQSLIALLDKVPEEAPKGE